MNSRFLRIVSLALSALTLGAALVSCGEAAADTPAATDAVSTKAAGVLEKFYTALEAAEG